jgi:hypothetical protein
MAALAMRLGTTPPLGKIKLEKRRLLTSALALSGFNEQNAKFEVNLKVKRYEDR